MKKTIVFVWMLAMVCTPLSALQMHDPSKRAQLPPTGPIIKVLLEKEAASAFLEARGSYRVIRKDSGTVLSYGKVGKRFVVHALQDGLRWGEEYPDVFQISVVPTERNTSIYVNGIQYKGAVSVYHMRGNRIAIINEVPIEDYLKSVLTVQYDDASLPKEAMAALAIAARTEAYNKVLQSGSSTRPWHITAADAGYFGFGVTHSKNGVEQAVDWSRFMVLESLKQPGPMKNVALSTEKAAELANKGCDAQKILTSLFPYTKLGATIAPDEVAIR